MMNLRIKDNFKTLVKTGMLVTGLLTGIPGIAKAHVALDYPKGGESLIPGEIISISWYIVIEHEQYNWDIYYSHDGGMNWELIVSDLPVSQKEYTWTVPENATDHARIRVIQDNVNTDYTAISEDFSIQIPASIDGEDNFTTFRYYPDRSTGTVTFHLVVSKIENITLDIYNLNGTHVESLTNKMLQPGEYFFEFKPVDAGRLFIYRMNAGTYNKSGLFPY